MVWTIKEQSLCEAIKSGLVSRINEALQNGADVNAKEDNYGNYGGKTPFMYACDNPNITPEIIQLLLDHDADVNAKNNYGGNTPFMYACANPNITPEIIQLLLDHGADINAKDNEGWTLLMYACANEHSKPETLHKLIELLVKKYKADLNEIDEDDKTALDRALGNDKMKSKTKKLLIKSGANISSYNGWSQTVLLRTTQKLSAIQQEMIADMTEYIKKVEAQRARNRFQDKKREKQRMRNVLLGNCRN